MYPRPVELVTSLIFSSCSLRDQLNGSRRLFRSTFFNGSSVAGIREMHSCIKSVYAIHDWVSEPKLSFLRQSRLKSYYFIQNVINIIEILQSKKIGIGR